MKKYICRVLSKKLSVAAVSVLVLHIFCQPVVAQSNPVPFINLPPQPIAIVAGTAGSTLAITGTGFVSGSVVNWNGKPLATTFVSPSSLTATIGSSDIATAGTASITVTNPRPGGGESNLVFLTVASAVTAPTFTALPSNGAFAFAGSILTADLNGDGKPDLAYLVWTLSGTEASSVRRLKRTVALAQLRGPACRPR